MRLIGEFQNEKEAFKFQVFLQNHGIKSLYESAQGGSAPVYRLWIIEEEDFDKALSYFQQWKPDLSPAFQQETSEQKPSPALTSTPSSWKVRPHPPLRPSFSVTNLIIVVCCFLSLWNFMQAKKMIRAQGDIAFQYGVSTPLQKELLFDYPTSLVDIENFLQQYHIKTSEDLKNLSPKAQEQLKKIQNAPSWNGVANMIVKRDWTLPEGTLFQKIREGQVWRLITPVFLHGNGLHLLFNMVWLFMLGRQVEERIGKGRYLFLSLLVGMAGNIAQYLVSGPIFLGYSGIITGLVGFIWVRQKIAPWEGYPLQRSVIVFITIFVAAMLALEIISMTLQFFHITDLYATIANTAHIIGGVFGIALGRLSLFARSHK